MTLCGIGWLGPRRFGSERPLEWLHAPWTDLRHGCYTVTTGFTLEWWSVH